jgi:hypothetical protein
LIAGEFPRDSTAFGVSFRTLFDPHRGHDRSRTSFGSYITGKRCWQRKQ